MDNKGLTSEWNEGTFKSIRLHETQEVLNALRMNPLGFSQGKFNYESMFIVIKHRLATRIPAPHTVFLNSFRHTQSHFSGTQSCAEGKDKGQYK